MQVHKYTTQSDGDELVYLCHVLKDGSARNVTEKKTLNASKKICQADVCIIVKDS